MQQVATLTGHSMRVLYLAASPDGSVMMLVLWNAILNSLLQTDDSHGCWRRDLTILGLLQTSSKGEHASAHSTRPHLQDSVMAICQ